MHEATTLDLPNRVCGGHLILKMQLYELLQHTSPVEAHKCRSPACAPPKGSESIISRIVSSRSTPTHAPSEATPAGTDAGDDRMGQPRNDKTQQWSHSRCHIWALEPPCMSRLEPANRRRTSHGVGLPGRSINDPD